ncbi:hypothetical protein BJV74DRAFT_884449 [Russula compacta]|nr:hypothetical protein BJV74DRAFT_884449 [Russula compacta]
MSPCVAKPLISLKKAIVGAASLSAFSLNVIRPHSRLGDYTHIPVIFGSLIVSNLLQSIGTIVNIRWVVIGSVSAGTLCSFQGGIKQVGNVGAAVWSFSLALHAFLLLFMRIRISTHSKWLTLGLGWSFIIFVVAIGPLAIQKKALEQYPAGQAVLEYMLEWMSALLSFVLYVTILLRVRGNLIQDTTGKWSLRWVPRSESWQLAFARDYLDDSTIKIAAIIVWYPVIYTVLIVPISIARFASYAGASVPHGFTFLADLIFALGGFANLLLFLGTRRFIPDPNTIPDLSTPRSRLDKGSSRAVGITPFKLTLKDAEAKPGRTTRTDSETLDPRESVGSFLSVASHESMLPLNPRW